MCSACMTTTTPQQQLAGQRKNSHGRGAQLENEEGSQEAAAALRDLAGDDVAGLAITRHRAARGAN